MTGWGLGFDKMPLAAALARERLGTARSFQQASHGLGPARLLCSWNSPGKNTGVGCRSLLQRIFLTQGSNPLLLHWQAGSLLLSQQLCLFSQSCQTLCNPMDCTPPGSSVHGILQARILDWVAMPSSKGSSHPRDLTQFSRICRRILYHLSHQ